MLNLIPCIENTKSCQKHHQLSTWCNSGLQREKPDQSDKSFHLCLDTIHQRQYCSFMCLFISSAEQTQLDFVEMLRVRDEKRRMRHMETLRRQKEEGEDEAQASRGAGARVELLGDLDEEQGSVSPSAKSKPQPPLKMFSYSHSSSGNSTTITNRQVSHFLWNKRNIKSESARLMLCRFTILF